MAIILYLEEAESDVYKPKNSNTNHTKHAYQ